MSETVFHVPDVPPRWRTWLWMLLPLLVLGAALGVASWHARSLVLRSLELAFGAGDYQHGWVHFEWDGDVHANDVQLRPSALTASEDSFSAASVHIETPGWLWFAGNLFNLDPLADRLERLQLRLEDLSAPAGIDPSLGDLGPFALAASPFEAEGCAGRRFWTRADFDSMDLQPGPTTLQFRYVSGGESLNTQVSLRVPGVSAVALERLERLPRSINVLLADQYPRLTISESWTVTDEGLVRARTRYCSNREHVEARELVERHVQLVGRLLETIGLTLNENSLQAYRRFSRDGGELRLTLHYQPPILDDALYTSRRSVEVLTAAGAELSHNGKPATAEWQRTDPRPLPGWSEGMASFDAWRQEQHGVHSDAQANPPPPATEVKQAPVLELEQVGVVVREHELQRLLPAPVPTLTPSPAPTPDPEPIVLSAPTPPTTPSVRNDVLQWSDLPSVVGQRLRIETITGGARAVELVAADAQEIQVRTRLGGGIAEYRIRREAFRSARLLR